MRSVLIALMTVFPVATTFAEDGQSDRIARVERGLHLANALVGDPGMTLEDRMEHYGVPGAAIAVIENGALAWFKVYGLADRETGAAVAPDTLFQAASISKPVSAMGAMTLVQEGKLQLDADINTLLSSWELPENKFTRKRKVTLTHLLSHTGGLTVHGFPGYAVGEPVPSLVQVLNGSGSANTAAIFVDKEPGASYRYSGGGITIMQQMMIDATGQSYPQLMWDRVLQPIGMKRSTYQQPLPPDLLKYAAAGVLPHGTAVPGKRHTYPEMAPAGLWTTAEDLAAFACEMQRALRGDSDVLSRDMAEAMIEPITPGYGRGFALENRNGDVYFNHGGWNEGFSSYLVAHRDAGYGAVVMINSNHPEFLEEVFRAVGVEYDWAGYELHEPRAVSEEALANFPGRYRYTAAQSVTIFPESGRLFLQYTGLPKQELLAIGDRRFVRRGSGVPITYTGSNGHTVFEFVLEDGGRQRHRRLRDDEVMPREMLAAGEYDQALEEYQSIKLAGDIAASQGNLNRQGLALIGEKNFDLGIDLLRINCKLYPESANTWYRLGYAYREKGDRANAIKYFELALQRDAEFPTAVRALEELENGS